jgi:hypothetical protein
MKTATELKNRDRNPIAQEIMIANGVHATCTHSSELHTFWIKILNLIVTIVSEFITVMLLSSVEIFSL